MKNSRQLFLLAAALLAALGGALAYKAVVRPFVAVDHCLDHGWRWDTKSAACAFSADKRPGVGDELLFDYTGLLEYHHEGVNAYLERIRDQDGIEMLIVVLPSLSQAELGETVQESAFRLFNHWQIGRDYNGRGVLVLMAADIRQVKIEVAQELEDVFTDLFSGYAADRQLKPHLEQGTLGSGLVAVMEEFEQRAYLKQAGNYTPQSIAARDRKLLAAGAGVRRELSTYEIQKPSFGKNTPGKKGAATPEKAWEITVSKWLGEGKYKDFDIYTEASKLISGDQDNLRYDWARRYKGKNYKILQNGDYAIVSFGKTEGWDNSPAFLMRTSDPDGWKVDFAMQRKYVVMGKAPYWSIELADHPYMNIPGLYSHAWTTLGKDIPLDPADIYTTDNDVGLAARYKALKASNTQDFETQMELGRLGVIMALLPQDIHPYLKKAMTLNPDSPLPHKYMAINTVESNYQYKTALAEMEKFLKKGGDPVFGYNYLGYLHMQTGDYNGAIKAFAQSLRAEEHNLYAYEKLSQCYAKTGQKTKGLGAFRKANAIAPDHWRTRHLEWWLRNRKENFFREDVKQ
ncbi:MAG: TPM domain-containing protein [Rhodospirillales bacterium]|nr:TPM domain-containing protein [Rhodospirillales bacterium]